MLGCAVLPVLSVQCCACCPVLPMQCCAVLCYQCCAVFCCSTSAMLCCAVLPAQCCAVLCCATNTMLCCATNAMLCCATNAMLCCAVQCSAVLSRAVLCYLCDAVQSVSHAYAYRKKGSKDLPATFMTSTSRWSNFYTFRSMKVCSFWVLKPTFYLLNEVSWIGIHAAPSYRFSNHCGKQTLAQGLGFSPTF